MNCIIIAIISQCSPIISKKIRIERIITTTYDITCTNLGLFLFIKTILIIANIIGTIPNKILFIQSIMSSLFMNTLIDKPVTISHIPKTNCQKNIFLFFLFCIEEIILIIPTPAYTTIIII